MPRVPAGGLGGYKRHGHRVLLRRGAILVRPSLLELSVFTGRPAIPDHLLERYRAALASLIKSQFRPGQAAPGGREGASALAAAVDLDTALECRGLDLASLEDASSLPLTMEAVQLKDRRLERWGNEATCGCMPWPTGGGGSGNPGTRGSGLADVTGGTVSDGMECGQCDIEEGKEAPATADQAAGATAQAAVATMDQRGLTRLLSLPRWAQDVAADGPAA